MKRVRFLSIILVIALMITSLGMPAFAFSATATEVNEGSLAASFSDNFDSYESDWSLTGNAVELGGGWVSKNAANGLMGKDNAAVFGFNNSKLKIGTYTGTHEHPISTIMQNEAGVLHVVPDTISENHTVMVSGEKTHESDMWGVKFLVHNDAKNYYVFLVSGKYTRGDNSYFSNYGLYKFEDGVKTLLVEMAGTGQHPNTQGGFASSGGATTLELSYFNGDISYNFVHKVGGTDAIVYSGCVTDTTPFTLENETLSVELFAAGSSNTSRAITFDNFSIKECVPYITTGEPTNVLYAEATQSAYTDTDGVVDMQEASRVRVIESAASASQNFDLYLSNDKTAWDKISNCSFDANGRWVNNKTGGDYRYIAFSFATVPSDLTVFTDANISETYTVVLGKDFDLKAKFGNVTDNTLFDWVLSEDSATIENGVLHPVRRGELSVSAIYEDALLTANVNIIGPLDMAEKNDTVAAYITENKPIIDEINAGIRTNDNLRIAAVFKNTGSYKIEDIIDIDSQKITALDEPALEQYIGRIKSYGELPFSNVGDAYALMELFETEYYVGQACNVSDRDAMTDVLVTRNSFFNLDLENEYYERYQNEVLDGMLNQQFDNVTDLRDTFVGTYVLIAFDKALSVEMLESVIGNCDTEIGYDAQHFEDNECDDLYVALLENKSTITTLDTLKDFIDTYEKPAEPVATPTPVPTVIPSGGGGGGGKVTITTDVVEAIQEQTKPEKIEVTDIPEEKPAAYNDLSDSHWAYESIQNLSALNIVSGNPDGDFRPDDAISRAEFLKILMLAFEDELAIDADGNAFSDVAQGDWYYEYVDMAYTAGIVKGDDSGAIRPNDKITREEMAVLIYRVLELLDKEITSVDSVFVSDMADVSDWAEKEVIVLYFMGILKGNSEGNFLPQNNATRAETCTVIERLLK